MRRKFAPLLLLAAAIGAYVTVDRHLPRDHDVVLDFGKGASEITDVEASWSRPDASGEADLTTRWHFAPGAAPSRLHARVHVPAGEWDVEVAIQRQGHPETTRWSGHVKLEATPFWKSDNVKDATVVLPVREAFR